jgi:hypothetical protein
VETSSTTTARLASCTEEQAATEANANWSKSMLTVARWMRRIGGKREKGRGNGFNYKDDYGNGDAASNSGPSILGQKRDGE